MTQQSDRARALKALHVKGSPLVLFNVWDGGSARRLAALGAKAIATSSWAVAAAQGYEDGQALPFERVLATAQSIVRAADLPVTVDVEAGYGASPDAVRATVAEVAALGVAGINLEDGVIGRGSLFPVEEQAARLEAARGASQVPIFINARTDLFLGGAPELSDAERYDQALVRAAAYAKAGADGLFVPGLVDEALIAALCEASPLPVNIMIMAGAPSPKRLAELGVARISYGPIPYLRALDAFQAAAEEALR